MSQRRLLKWRLTRGAEPAAPVPAPRRCGRARDRLRGFAVYCPVPLGRWRVVPVSAVRRLGRGSRARARLDRQ